jgi:hypothetical protein
MAAAVVVVRAVAVAVAVGLWGREGGTQCAADSLPSVSIELPHHARQCRRLPGLRGGHTHAAHQDSRTYAVTLAVALPVAAALRTATQRSGVAHTSAPMAHGVSCTPHCPVKNCGTHMAMAVAVAVAVVAHWWSVVTHTHSSMRGRRHMRAARQPVLCVGWCTARCAMQLGAMVRTTSRAWLCVWHAADGTQPEAECMPRPANT